MNTFQINGHIIDDEMHDIMVRSGHSFPPRRCRYGRKLIRCCSSSTTFLLLRWVDFRSSLSPLDVASPPSTTLVIRERPWTCLTSTAPRVRLLAPASRFPFLFFHRLLCPTELTQCPSSCFSFENRCRQRTQPPGRSRSGLTWCRALVHARRHRRAHVGRHEHFQEDEERIGRSEDIDGYREARFSRSSPFVGANSHLA
jgi:hypothetical protein